MSEQAPDTQEEAEAMDQSTAHPQKRTPREKTKYIFSGFQQSNTTPVPDVFFDELLTELTGAQMKVLLYIFRRTRGFKKDTDAISLTQFQKGITTKDGKILDKGCGLSDRTTILDALHSLEEMGCITITKYITDLGDNGISNYGIAFDRNSTNGVVGNSNQGSRENQTTGGRKFPSGGSGQTRLTRNTPLTRDSKQGGGEHTEEPSQELSSSSENTVEGETPLTNEEKEQAHLSLVVKTLRLYPSQSLLTLLRTCRQDHPKLDLLDAAQEMATWYTDHKSGEMSESWFKRNLAQKIEFHVKDTPKPKEVKDPTTSISGLTKVHSQPATPSVPVRKLSQEEEGRLKKASDRLTQKLKNRPVSEWTQICHEEKEKQNIYV